MQKNLSVADVSIIALKGHGLGCPHKGVKKGSESKCYAVENFQSNLCIDNDIEIFADTAYFGTYSKTVGQRNCIVQSRPDQFFYAPQEYYFPTDLCHFKKVADKRVKNKFDLVCTVDKVDGKAEEIFKLPFARQGHVVPVFNSSGDAVRLRFEFTKAPIYSLPKVSASARRSVSTIVPAMRGTTETSTL